MSNDNLELEEQENKRNSELRTQSIVLKRPDNEHLTSLSYCYDRPPSWIFGVSDIFPPSSFPYCTSISVNKFGQSSTHKYFSWRIYSSTTKPLPFKTSNAKHQHGSKKRCPESLRCSSRETIPRCDGAQDRCRNNRSEKRKGKNSPND